MSTISKNHHLVVEDFQSDFCPKCGALIDLDTLPDTAGQEVILLGRISGTFAVRRLT